MKYNIILFQVTNLPLAHLKKKQKKKHHMNIDS